MRPGNAIARKHPPELTASVGNLDEFRQQLVADQGGDDELPVIRSGYVQRLTEVELLCRWLGADLRARGIFTKKGRVRSTFGAYLQAIEKWDRLAQRLGIERRQRDVSDMSLSEYFAALDRSSEPAGSIDGGNTNTDHQED